jgi:RNA polymerase sigma-70 factor (ECF subfamily)
MDISDHLFRHESGRMVSALTRVFGTHSLALAEDVVQEAFCRALEVWRFRGVPANPPAWLMATAKHCALDRLRRERTARTFAPELGRLLDSEWTLDSTLDELLSAHMIKDDVLRMMFSCCHPRLAEESQVALILNILCGFSLDESAAAFVSSRAALEKRLTRAKKVLASSTKLFDVLASAEVAARLSAVHRALYLLFNEGYHGASSQTSIRNELCQEAIRLVVLLAEHPKGATPTTFALSALMCLDAARLPGRVDTEGQLISLFEQDRSLWDRDLINTGFKFLEQSADGDELTEYHLEAAISAQHAAADNVERTNWEAVVTLYDQLMRVSGSPIVALNRAIALSQLSGPERGLEEIGAIIDGARLASYPFLPAAIGELQLRRGDHKAAAVAFRTALRLARNVMETHFLERRLAACDASINDADPSPASDRRARNEVPLSSS